MNEIVKFFEASRRGRILLNRGPDYGLMPMPATDLTDHASFYIPLTLQLPDSISSSCAKHNDSLPLMPFEKTIICISDDNHTVFFFVTHVTPSVFYTLVYLKSFETSLDGSPESYIYTGVMFENTTEKSQLRISVPETVLERHAKAWLQSFMFYTNLLNHRAISLHETDDAVMIGLNRKRVRVLGLPRLPMPRIIRVDEVPSHHMCRDTGEIGSIKSAHDRRGHYRVCQSGKRVWVNASKIHGGSDQAPTYKVAD